jgi:hypothetical protein
LQSVYIVLDELLYIFGVKIFSGAHQQNFAGASILLARLLPQNPRQQNLRCASKISDAPAKSLTLMIFICHVKINGLK